jgi:1-acyl-sn-glycerol-3-phosphate acyltransferase
VAASGRTGIDRIITRLAGRAVAIFHRFECQGGPVPDGPVLITANHPNSLLDPLIVFRASGRVARPLAKAPLFEQAILGTVLRALGGLPVYRRQDDPAQMHRNDQTFSAAIGALHAGDAVQIFPEGRSHSEPSLVEMRTGAARIAIAAEEAAGWQLGLRTASPTAPRRCSGAGRSPSSASLSTSRRSAHCTSRILPKPCGL